MQIVINIPEETYNEVCWRGLHLCPRDNEELVNAIKNGTPQPKTGHCKNCKYFEYDHVENVDGIMLIVAHEFCKKWGNGCKTNENGYCFLFEPKERKVNE